MVRMRMGLAVICGALALAVAGCSAGSRPTADSAAGSNARPAGPLPGPAGTPSPADDAKPAPGPSGVAFNQETRAADNARSTFAVDVDTASYTYARRQLTDGRRPDPATVRPEEFVNYFKQDYPQPNGNGFTVTVDGARAPGWMHAADNVRVVRVGLQTKAEDPGARPDAALTFVVDVSGSMAEPGRLDLVVESLHTLVDQLRPTDSVALVTFSDTAKVIRPMTSVADRAGLHDAIGKLRTEGSTNLEAGLTTGFQVARQGLRDGATNRVVLLSDGLANSGDTSAESLVSRLREEAGKRVALLGVGVGSQYGDKLMETLADKGDGFVVYVSDRAQAKRVFVNQLPATLAIRALDAKVQVTFRPETVDTYRLVGFDNRVLASRDFRNDAVDGGEVGPGHSVTALYVVKLRPGGGQLAEARVRWQDPKSREATEAAGTVTAGDVDRAYESAPARLRVDCSAAFFAEVLRRNPYAGPVALDGLSGDLADLARKLEDPDVTDLATATSQATRTT